MTWTRHRLGSVISVRSRLPLGFVAGVVLATSLLGAVPAGAATSPQKWAHSVCGALDSWVDEVHAASEKVAASKPTSAANVRKKLTKLLARTQSETSALIADLKAAGQPDVKGGKQIAATIREGFRQVLSSIADAKKSLAKVKTKDSTAFMNAARSVQDALESSLEGVQAAFSAVRTADVAPLLAAFAADKRCEAVAS
jgi:hypothetical protein